MSYSRLFVLLLMLATALTAERAAAVEPFDMVRALNALQSQMALGDISARDATSKQIERIEQTLPAVAPEAWKDPKNARAAAIYLLSGGSSGAVHNLLEAHAFSKDDEALISGSLAYAEGHSRDAAKLLQPIDPKTVSPILGGHLALVGGGLLIGADNPRALDLLDLARLLMPGSLVEEAALRRQISVIDGAHDPEKLLLLGRRYVARYRHSPFAPNFWDEFAASIARIALDIDEPLLVKFEELFREMNASAKFEVYLTIAQRAILNGRIALATDQTNRAEPFAESPAARNRLKLYNALVWAISGNFEDGLAGLELIDSKSLARADAELREIVTAAVKQLQESPDADAPKPAPISALPKQEAEATVAARSPIESSAQQAIADADAMLRKASEQ